MSKERLKKIEQIFRNSTSPDELFDAFQDSMKLKVDNLEIYNLLLGNPALSTDELKMFSEKLIKEFPQNAYDLSMWVARVFENVENYRGTLDNAIHYYKRAKEHSPNSSDPLIGILSLFNYDLDIPSNKTILEFVEKEIGPVKIKSNIYYALAEHYKRTGEKQLEIKYSALAERSSEIENSSDQ